MWHAARKQEKKLRGLMVDYKKRAERRRSYYEMIKKDPCSFLRLVGTSMKVNIDPAIAQAAESDRTMMAWNGDPNNMIDRFDARSHLDLISQKTKDSLPDALELEDDMKCNYDRYRIIVQNDAAGIPEEAALRQIEVDEKYGDISKHAESEKDKKKVLASSKAAINFSYDDTRTNEQSKKAAVEESSEEESDEDFAELDLDIAFDIDEISSDLKQQLDVLAMTFGMSVGEFSEQLRKDKQDQIDLKQARIEEEQKAALSGRRSRRERRIFKDNLLRLRGNSPPRYMSDIAAPRDSPTYNKREVETDSDSSNSPEREGEFITTFGDSSKEKSRPVDFQSFIKLPNQGADNPNSLQNKWRKQRLRSESPTFKNSPSNSPTTSSIEYTKFNNSTNSSHDNVIKKYRQESSSSDDSDSDEDKPVSSYRQRQADRYDRKSNNSSTKATTYSGAQSSSKLSAQERIKRKMKAALNKTYKDDKKKQAERKELKYQERKERDAEMRSVATELRRRERERMKSSSSSRSRSRSRSPSHSRSYSSSAHHRGPVSYGGYNSSYRIRTSEITSSSSKYRRSRSRSRSRERRYH